MFRSALAAALRHLYCGKLYAAIAVFGLAVGLCAALLAALHIRSQYSYDHFVAGYRDVYVATMRFTAPRGPASYYQSTPLQLAALMKQRFPEIAAITRMQSGGVLLRLGNIELGDVEGRALIASVDPNFFDTLPLPVVAGDPAATMAKPDQVVMTAILGLVILAIAAVNFVNLLTARSGARVLEVGVRKLAGASRATLALQFLGEAFVYVTVAIVAAVAMTELLLPHVNAFLLADAEFKYWKEPALLGGLVLGVGVFGLLAGFWPALVLSALRPLGAMHGARLARGSGGLLRQLLVSLQFALLTGLMLTAGVMYLQRHYATQQALRFDTDQVLILEMRCTPARMIELRKLAGVRDAACSGSPLLGGSEGSSEATTRDNRSIRIEPITMDDRMLELYGIKPLVGRGLAATDFNPAAWMRHSTRYLINESAARAMGFDSPAAALGLYPLTSARIAAGRRDAGRLEEIIGVVPDFSMGPVDNRIGPTLFYADPMQFSTISMKLRGADIPATLAALDRLWKDTGTGGDGYSGASGSLNRVFYDDRVQRMYQSMLREARAFGIMSLVAIVLALLGLLGLAAAAAEQRTKEIGIRKALGATTGDVLRLLLWQFSKPVVCANLIAWPVAGWAMQRWLNGFAYHIDLPLWLFPATLLVTALIALATVSAHALRVARAKPVTALRHE